MLRSLSLAAPMALLVLGLAFARSPDAPTETMVMPQFAPYNRAGYQELNLWQLEERRFIRSAPVISPDKSLMAYTEVVHIPSNRQTFAKLYLVPVSPPPQVQPEHRPSEAEPPPPVSPTAYLDSFNPNKTLQQRRELLGVGHDRTLDWEFRTLTIVDWSASTNRLLFKQRSGVLHIGLRTSDILIYDRSGGTVTIYPELQRILQNYWKTHGNLPQLERLAWDIYPLGWEPGSDSAILFNAWAFDKREKKFLGLWRYDLDSQRSELVSEQDIQPILGGNGLLLQQPEPVVIR